MPMRLLLILIPISAIGVIGFVIALCRAAASADALQERELLERPHKSGAPLAPLPRVQAVRQARFPGERPRRMATVFLVDELAGRVEPVGLQDTARAPAADSAQPVQPGAPPTHSECAGRRRRRPQR
jgi:hypothetical protein